MAMAVEDLKEIYKQKQELKRSYIDEKGAPNSNSRDSFL